jgi:hypothetical protein
MMITHANTPTTINATIVPMTPATIDGVCDLDSDWRGTAVALPDELLDAADGVEAFVVEVFIVEACLVVVAADVLEVSDVGKPRETELVGKVSGTVKLRIRETKHGILLRHLCDVD